MENSWIRRPRLQQLSSVVALESSQPDNPSNRQNGRVTPMAEIQPTDVDPVEEDLVSCDVEVDFSELRGYLEGLESRVRTVEITTEAVPEPDAIPALEAEVERLKEAQLEAEALLAQAQEALDEALKSADPDALLKAQQDLAAAEARKAADAAETTGVQLQLMQKTVAELKHRTTQAEVRSEQAEARSEEARLTASQVDLHRVTA